MRKDYKIKKLLLICLLGSSTFSVMAQEAAKSAADVPKVTNVVSHEWTLEQCIAYALSHNTTIRSQQNNVATKNIDRNTAKYSRLPNLSASANQNFGWGRTPSPADNSYISKNSSSTSYNISASVPIFTGFKLHNQYKLAKLNLQTALASLDKAKDDLSVKIASQYLQVLFNDELSKVAIRQANLSKEQLERIQKLYAIGKKSQADVAEAKARYAQDQMKITQTGNDYQLALLELAQSLQLPSFENFKLIVPEELIIEDNLPIMGDIYTTALGIRPSIRSARLQVKAGEYGIKIARSGYSPTLSLQGSISSQYYKIAGLAARNFTQQFNDNLYKTIGLSLRIPIFNRFETRNSIRKAKVTYSNYQLRLEDEKKKLFNEIQRAWYNATAAQAKYKSAQASVSANKEAFRSLRQKFEQGQATSLQFNESKFNLMKAESDVLQAKYDYIFRSKILHFYNGGNLK